MNSTDAVLVVGSFVTAEWYWFSVSQRFVEILLRSGSSSWAVRSSAEVLSEHLDHVGGLVLIEAEDRLVVSNHDFLRRRNPPDGRLWSDSQRTTTGMEVVVDNGWGRARLILAAMALADAATSGATAWSGDDTLTESIARRLHAGTVFRSAYGAEGHRVHSRLQALPPLRPLPGAAG